MSSDRTAATLLALALGAGATDAASYLGLGHVFTANMTGNTVLLAVDVVRGAGAEAARSGTALGGFCLGVAGGVALVRVSRRGWPWVAGRVFMLEGVVLAALLAGWEIAGARALRFPLIILAAVAMGAQSAAVRASDVRGVNTTYMTSTLQNAIARLVLRARGEPPGLRAGGGAEDRRAPGLPGITWLIYGIGALGGAAATQAWGGAVIAGPLAVVIAIVVLAAVQADKERSHGGDRS